LRGRTVCVCVCVYLSFFLSLTHTHKHTHIPSLSHTHTHTHAHTHTHTNCSPSQSISTCYFDSSPPFSRPLSLLFVLSFSISLFCMLIFFALCLNDVILKIFVDFVFPSSLLYLFILIPIDISLSLCLCLCGCFFKLNTLSTFGGIDVTA